MKFQIIIPPTTSASSSRLHPSKPQPLPTAAAAARPATIIAKRPRGRPPRKLRSKEEKLDAIARHLHVEYKWSLKDVIKHFVVDEPEREEGDTSTSSAITTTTRTRKQQQQQQGRVGALIDAIWGQPEVLRELQAHPAFPQSFRKRRGSGHTEGDVSAGGIAEDDENEGEGNESGSRSAEEDETEEGDEMSVDSGQEASADDQNGGEMSVGASAEDENGGETSVASAEDENEGEMSLEASAEDENERKMSVTSAKDENDGEMSVEASSEDGNEGETSVEASAEDENEGEMSVEASAENENQGHLSVEASAEDQNEAEAISGSTQDVVSPEENPPTSGHSYSTQDEEEVPSPPSKLRMYIPTNQTNIPHYRNLVLRRQYFSAPPPPPPPPAQTN